MTRASASRPLSRTFVPASAALTIALGVCACTSAPQKTAAVESHRVGDVVQDDAYVDQVERIARRRGIGITWINAPSRRVAASEAR